MYTVKIVLSPFLYVYDIYIRIITHVINGDINMLWLHGFFSQEGTQWR